jgi:hypothetical protein
MHSNWRKLTDWAELGMILPNTFDSVKLHIHRLPWPQLR